MKEQIESLNSIGIENKILFINGREKGKREYLKSICKIKMRLKKERFDIIHCHHALSALFLILSGCCKRNKILVSFQNDPINEMGKIIFKIIRKNTSGYILKNNSSLIDDKFSYYLPNGVNTLIFIPIKKQIACRKLNLDPQKRYILFVSSNRIRKQKRYDIYKETVSILKNRYVKCEELVLINTRRELIPYYFNASEIHLLTSDYEGSPNSVKEAMACNIPVVSTNVGNVRTLLENVNGNFISETNDANELADLVEIALNFKGINSRERIKELELDIHSVAKKLKGIYKNILIK
ncbi:MAG: glycosyltransferase family 4 protein [Mariniphaga sp.]|nr:glycosyltransferase family 4 protein [Mariniphaga sp.]